MGDSARGRTTLARIRGFQACLASYKKLVDFPKALCYVPKRVEYKCVRPHTCTLYSAALPPGALGRASVSTTTVQLNLKSRVVASGHEYVDSKGQWLKISSIDVSGTGHTEMKWEQPVWLLLRPLPSAHEQDEHCASTGPSLEAVTEGPGAQDEYYENVERSTMKISSWMDLLEAEYSLTLYKLGSPRCSFEVTEADEEAMKELSALPPSWSSKHDDELISHVSKTVETDADVTCTAKSYIESIEVSSASEGDGEDNLVDGDDDTYWESDGNHGQHWIRLKMKRGTIISKLIVTLDSEDDNYLPERIQVFGGDTDNLKLLSDAHLSLSFEGIHDECVLQNMTAHYPIIEIRVKRCKDDGIDTRIHNIKLLSSKERFSGLVADYFANNKLECFPLIQSYDKLVLYRRAQCLQRLAILLDSILNFLVPEWGFSTGALDMIQDVKSLIPLSRRRSTFIETFIKETETGSHFALPKLYINRRLAADHRSDPSQDPEGARTVFCQIYEGLKPRGRDDKALDYRWPAHMPQWWECKFVAEGIIDQGGGFRDSLCDIADELCPSANDVPLVLPYFVRSPNQSNVNSNVLRDVYVPNPSCKKFAHYRWIGQLMGACMRSKERLVLSFPSFIWKKLIGEKVVWEDFSAVDIDEVQLLESMETMKEDVFSIAAAERTWTTVLSNGEAVELQPGGFGINVSYEDRLEYVRLVRERRMNEVNDQIDALRQGLLSVVPQAVLSLMTWQEVEKRICGDPEITIEALKKCAHYEDVDSSDENVKYLWEALANFSNDDRSRFLRFVTGRRRLPCPLYICNNRSAPIDSLPESSTCSNTLYLPKYTSPKVAEEKLRYAAYNCIAIDTDVSPWDE